MAMEPPPKRRRKGQSPMDQENEGDDDDELSFQPFEVEAKRDPGYKLSIERAYADQRFQATMAHIFEKYGRDFEGIGDEIDLVTGEIVVNNGHIRNMRNEGDVGYDLDEEEEEGEDDEDEGILLEDLIDEDEEEDGEEGEGFEDDEHHDNEGGDAIDEEEEDRIMQGRQPSHKSTALVPLSGSKTPSSMIRGHPPSLFPGRHGSDALGFGHSHLAFGSSPFAFSSSPLAGGLWDLPGQFSDPLWDHPDFTVARQARPQRLPIAGRYNFPAKEGQSSIWAPRSKYKDDEDEPLRSVFSAALGKHLARKRTKSRKSILPPEPKKPTNDDEEDEEAILTGKSSRQKKSHDNTVIEATDEDDDDLVLSGRKSSKSQNIENKEAKKDTGEDAPRVTQGGTRGRKRKRRAAEGTTAIQLESGEETSGFLSEAQPQQPEAIQSDAANVQPTEDSQGVCDRRRSGRVRKQVEFLNKISWAEALAERRSQKMTIVLPTVDPHSREDYKRLDSDTDLETQPTPLVVESSALEPEQDNTQITSEREAITDPQNNSSGDQRSPQSVADHDQGPGSESTRHTDTDSACILSDDEAPTFLSKPRNRRTEKSDDSGAEIPPIVGDLTPSITEPLVDCEAISDGVMNTDNEKEAEDLSEVEAPVLSVDDTTQVPDETTDTISNSPVKSSPPRKSPKKGVDAADKITIPELIIELEDNICLPSDDLIGAAPMSSSPTRALTRFTAEVSLNDKPKRLAKEIQWLRTRAAKMLSSSPSAPDGLESPELNGGRRRRGRPRKSTAVVEQAATVITEQPAVVETPQDEQTREAPAASLVIEDSSYETAEEPQVDTSLPSPRRTASPVQVEKRTPAQSPSKPTPLEKPTFTPSLSSRNPQTPRHIHRHSSLKAPSSRRSILSLLSDNDDGDEEMDELGRNLAAMPKLLSSGAHTTAARRIWKSSARTTEVYHTPIKKRPTEPISPGSIVKTPGGTVRACGLNGYRCGRDFCFTCL